MLPVLLLLLLSCFRPPSASALQFGVVTPARLSEAVLSEAKNQSAHSQCTGDFTRWIAALSSGERWAAEMADSWTKSFTGLFHGNTYDFGDFNECIDASSETEDQTPSTASVIRGAYMLTSVSLSPTKKVETPRNAAEKLLSEVAPVSMNVALCVPDSCDTNLLVSAAGSVARELMSEEGLGDSFRASVSLVVGKLQTKANAHKPGAAHWIYLSVFAFLFLCAVVATTLDNKLDKTENKEARHRWRYLLHFSLSSGMQRIMAPAPASSMTSINGIRVLSTLWIVVGHTFDYWPPIVNSSELEKFKTGVWSMILTSYTLSVDTFLTVGGLVCCISFMRAVNKANSFNWLKYIIHRYARTTPALIAVTFYGFTWLNTQTPGVNSYFLGEESFTVWYESYWWTAFLHISNFFAKFMAVLPHTWYVSVDMQLYILAPIVMIPLWKSELIGKIVLGVATLVAGLIPAILATVYKAMNENGPKNGTFQQLWDQRLMFYMGTECRIGAYVVGIAAGYFLYKLKYGGLKYEFNRYHAAAMWLVSAITALAVVFGPYSILHDGTHSYSAVESFFYLGFLKVAWGAAVSLVIIACETGWGGPVNKFLSLGVFAPLGKLSFSVYLVHYFIVVTEMAYLVHVVEYFSLYVFIRRIVSSLALAMPLAAMLSLLVEQPFMLMENELWK